MSPRPLLPERRERIYLTAERLILARGFDGMSMQALADEVGVAKGAIYREFPSKEALLEELLALANARLQRRVVSSVGGAFPSVSASYRAWATALLEEPLLCAAYTDNAGVLGSRVERVDDNRYRERHRTVEQWIGALQADGRLTMAIDPDALALALSSATLGLLTAAKTLGPLTREQIGGALNALAFMIEGLENE